MIQSTYSDKKTRRKRSRMGRIIFATSLVAGYLNTVNASEPSGDVKPIAPRPRSIHFDHSKHKDNCVSCHSMAIISELAGDKLTPNMEVCVPCHTETQPKIETCGGCHVGYKPSKRQTQSQHWSTLSPAPLVLPQPKGTIRFSHKTHNAQSCESCHALNTGTQTPSMPQMSQCMECHDGQKASDACSSCHTDMKSAQKPTSTSASRKLKPLDHNADWLKRHAFMAQSTPETCSSCHTPQDCASCHITNIAKPTSVHPPNFVIVHASEAQLNSDRCTNCHTVDTFCADCHTRSNLFAPDLAPARKTPNFHPPGFAGASQPGNHADMARQQLSDCITCHTQQDCITCHVAINPHPAAFQSNCKTALRSNPTPCLKCHQDLSLIEQVCQ